MAITLLFMRSCPLNTRPNDPFPISFACSKKYVPSFKYMNIMRSDQIVMYILSNAVQSHKRDLRSLDYDNGLLVTGGKDQILQFYSYKGGQLNMMTKSDIFDRDILCVKINKLPSRTALRVLVGCANGKIYGFDEIGNPLCIFEHDQQVNSLDFINEDHFVSGSWDGKAIVWSISKNNRVIEYPHHKYAVAVFYNNLNDSVVSGSQDKALNSWSWRDGSKLHRIQNAHNDIIREIVKVQELGFMTCSNDETLKLWNNDLELVQCFSGHQGFVFSVKCFSLGSYCSGGDGKTIKVWEQDVCKQDIHVPGEVWSLALDEEGNIIAGCSDGYLRIFTKDSSRKASEEVMQVFSEQMMASAAKRSGLKPESIVKLPTTAQLNAFKGKKQGEVKVFRNGQVPEAFMWETDHWERIGEVLSEPGQGISAQPRDYPGDRFFPAGLYDFIFDVEDESGIPKRIPFNAGGNALEAAELYCKREELSKAYVQQIRKFLVENTKNIPPRQQNLRQNQVQEKVNLIGTPCTAKVEFLQIKNPAALIKKLKQFNEITTINKLNEREFPLIERLAVGLQKTVTYHSWKMDFKEMDAFKKLLSWPREYKVPVWDILRAFFKHYQSEELFSGLEGGRQILADLCFGLQMEQPQPVYTLILKVFTNSFIHNTNTNAFLRHSDFIFNSFKGISSNSNLQSQNFNSAFGCFLLNFSIALIEKQYTNIQLIRRVAQIIHERLKMNISKENKGILLQTAANILFKYKQQTIRQNFQFLLQFLQDDDSSKDLSILLK